MNDFFSIKRFLLSLRNQYILVLGVYIIMILMIVVTATALMNGLNPTGTSQIHPYGQELNFANFMIAVCLFTAYAVLAFISVPFVNKTLNSLSRSLLPESTLERVVATIIAFLTMYFVVRYLIVVPIDWIAGEIFRYDPVTKMIFRKGVFAPSIPNTEPLYIVEYGISFVTFAFFMAVSLISLWGSVSFKNKNGVSLSILIHLGLFTLIGFLLSRTLFSDFAGGLKTLVNKGAPEVPSTQSITQGSLPTLPDGNASIYAIAILIFMMLAYMVVIYVKMRDRQSRPQPPFARIDFVIVGAYIVSTVVLVL